MSLFAADKITAWAGGQKGVLGAATEPELLDRLLVYRRDVAKKYRTIDQGLIDRALPPGEFLLSGKLDGELWFLRKVGGEVYLVAYNGRILAKTPLVTTLARALDGVGDALIAGELVARPADGRPRVQHVAAALNDERLEETLSFRPFDLVELPGGDLDEPQRRPYKERFAWLERRFGGDDRSGVVPTLTADGKAVEDYFKEWVQGGRFEGLVLRSEHGLTFKLKPYFSIDAVVIAFGMRVQGGAPQVRELSLGLLRDDGRYQLIGTVGGGFKEEERIAWAQKLQPLAVASSFRMANRDGTLCTFVAPKIVVEVKATDLVETDANDVPVRRKVFTFDDGGGWTGHEDANVPSLLFPVFKGERADKTVDVACVGMTQLTSRLPSAEESTEAPRVLAPTETIARRVFVKGATAVRKVVLLDTHKGPKDGYARYAVFGTDYSAGRAEPLKTTLRTASTRERADAHVAAWLEENVKKGWTEVGPDAPPPPAAAEPPAKKPRAKKDAAATAEPATAEPATTEGATAEEAPAKKPRAKKAKGSTDGAEGA